MCHLAQHCTCILAENSCSTFGLLTMLYGTLEASIALQFFTLYQLRYNVARKVAWPSRLNFACHVYVQNFKIALLQLHVVAQEH